jgi:hypothetical protein
MRASLLLIATLLALLVATPAVAQEAPADGKPAPAPPPSLRFDWPVGLDARVETEYARRRLDGDEQIVQRNRVRFRFRVEPSEHGVRVHVTERMAEPVSFASAEGPVLPRERQSAETRIGTEIALLFPTFDVHLGGRIRTIEPIDEIREFMERRIEEVGSYQPLQPTARARLLTDYASQAAAARHMYITWRWLVIYWLALGSSGEDHLEIRNPGKLPDLKDLRVEFVTRIENEGPVRCRAADAEERCVRLVGQHFPDGLQLQQVIAAIPQLESYGAGWDLTLIAEPDTLVPHSLVFRDEYYGERLDEEGNPFVFESLDERRYWFFYHEPIPRG